MKFFSKLKERNRLRWTLVGAGVGVLAIVGLLLLNPQTGPENSNRLGLLEVALAPGINAVWLIWGPTWEILTTLGDCEYANSADIGVTACTGIWSIINILSYLMSIAVFILWPLLAGAILGNLAHRLFSWYKNPTSTTRKDKATVTTIILTGCVVMALSIWGLHLNDVYKWF